MKIEVAKRDLESALAVVTNTVGSTQGDIVTHFLFRKQGDLVEVLSSNRRIFSSTPMVAKVTQENPEISSFTIEAKRLKGAKGWLSAVEDGVISLELKEGTVVGTSSRGSIKFPSLNPSDFPFWDELEGSLKVMCDVDPKVLRGVLDHAVNFVSDDETSKPQYCVVEYREDAFYSARQEAISRVVFPALKGSRLRIHGKDVKSLTNFLNQFSGNVSVLESDRAFLIKTETGATFGEMKYHVEFPNMSGWEVGNQFTWKMSAKEIIDGIRFLVPGMDHSDDRVLFIAAEDGSGVELGVESVAGGVTAIPLTLLDKSDPPYEGADFFVHYPTLIQVLNGFADGDGEVLIGVNPLKGGQGYLKILRQENDLEFLNIVAWLIP